MKANENNLIYRGKNNKEETNNNINHKINDESISNSKNYSNPKIFKIANERKFLPIFTYLPLILNIFIAFKQISFIKKPLLITFLDILFGMIIPFIIFPGDCAFKYELYFTLLRYLNEAKKRLPISLIISFIFNIFIKYKTN